MEKSTEKTSLLESTTENHRMGHFPTDNNKSTKDMKSVHQLKKSIGCVQGFCFIVSILIGSGVFISPGLVMADTNDVVVSMVVWVVCGMIAFGGSLLLLYSNSEKRKHFGFTVDH